ncbi:MAG: DUF1475 family protein [Chloroflexi bacterium]|jgi:hypothetical protein|nr:DUF1475 family protein [Chloroflexota bacterium]
MKLAKILTIFGALAMGWALFHGFTKGDLRAEGSLIGSMPWGVVSLVDVYVGFFLFSGWVIYREKSILIALLWVISFLVLGNFVTSIYALLALFHSSGNWKKFWLGKNYRVTDQGGA